MLLVYCRSAAALSIQSHWRRCLAMRRVQEIRLENLARKDKEILARIKLNMYVQKIQGAYRHHKKHLQLERIKTMGKAQQEFRCPHAEHSVKLLNLPGASGTLTPSHK